MFVLTKIWDYLELVECYSCLQDAQDRMIDLACEDLGIQPPDFEALEKEIMPNGSLDAMFIDPGTMNSATYRIDDCEVH